METIVKFNIMDCKEEDWILEDYAKGKFRNLTDENLTEIIAEIIRDAIEGNRIYYDCDDAEKATQEILPAISALILNKRFDYVRTDYDMLIEMVSYLTVRLA